jgi:hypothetical protein
MRGGWWRWLIDGALPLSLGCALALVYWGDHRAPPKIEEAKVTPVPKPTDEPPPMPEIPAPKDVLPPIDPVPRIRVQCTADCRFGVTTIAGSSQNPGDDNKRLTYSPDGATNNTRLWVDGESPLFGGSEGVRRVANEPLGEGGFKSVWEFAEVQSLQRIELVASDISRRMDTIRVSYEMKNVGNRQRNVGLRVMLDTLIGNNDGVPFIVPGNEGIVTYPITYQGERVPDFVRAIERPDLVNPGVIVDIGLHPLEGERPAEVVISHWPGSDAAWDYDRTRELGSDSAVGLYYTPHALAPGQARSVSFTYGLGTLSSTKSKNARLSLTCGGPFRSGGSFWIVALVQNPREGQQVRLSLPTGLSLAANDPAAKPVAAGKAYNQISWLVHAANDCSGKVDLKVTLMPDSVQEQQAITVETPATRVNLFANAEIQEGKSFWAVAVVQRPQAGQSLTLVLSPGIGLAKDESAQKPVPMGADPAQVKWLVRAARGKPGAVTLQVRLLPGENQATCPVKISATDFIH